MAQAFSGCMTMINASSAIKQPHGQEVGSLTDLPPNRYREVGNEWVVHARVTEQLMRPRLRYVADRLDAVLNEAARTEPTYLDFLDTVLRQEANAKKRTRVTMGPQKSRTSRR